MNPRILPAALLIAAVAADADSLRIDVGAPAAPVAPSLYGVFFEEINHAGDGGLYAELIRNRSFEETVPVEGCTLEGGVCRGPVAPSYRSGQDKDWSVKWSFPSPWPAWSLDAGSGAARLSLETRDPVHPANVNYLRLAVTRPGARLLNEGYWGIAAKQGETYECSFWARLVEGPGGAVTVGLVGADGRELGAARVEGAVSKDWKKHAVSFPILGNDPKATFFLRPEVAGTLDLDVISLFPRRTFKDRPNGLRADLAQLLAEIKPAFLRFPGGCVVEGATMANRWQWKNTVGDVAERPGHWSLWGYRNTDGLGYHEFLQFCEDIGCDGMFVCNVGLSCEYRNGDYWTEEQLEPLIRDTLDAVEYALGGPETKGGAARARAGHPAPFPLKYVEIGNENHGPIYDRYYNRFAAALRQAWPRLTLIFNGGTTDIGPGRAVQNVDLLDEHYYRDANWFFDNFGRYDQVPRDRGYDVYVGEFACNRGVGSGNLLAALSEAVFMMGMERNGDLVKLCSYAPLLFNVNRLDWPVNMIGYDSAVSFGRSSYYAQKLMAEHRPDVNLKHELAVDADPAAAKPAFAGGFGLGAYDTDVEYRDFVVEQDGREVYRAPLDGASGWEPRGGTWKAAGGVMRVTGPGQRRIAVVGGQSLETGVIRVKARKLAGKEGFLVVFGARPGADGDFHELNLGGWGNTGHDIEAVRGGRGAAIGERRASPAIATGRWYDVRVEIRRGEVVAYLDGREVTRARVGGATRVFAIAGLDRAKREVIIKAVNATAAPRKVDIQLAGATPSGEARRLVLSAASPEDENTVAAPRKIVPREEKLPVPAAAFPADLPPWSLTILRLPVSAPAQAR